MKTEKSIEYVSFSDGRCRRISGRDNADKIKQAATSCDATQTGAALRYWQEQGLADDPEKRSDELHDIATANDAEVSMDSAGIDTLCEKLGEPASSATMRGSLTKILRAHDSGNNGAYMGEASLCQYFATMARHALANDGAA